jgi:peptidoglycan/xylan/chitin deacetylase (PgdA/CDA1 family)
MKHPRKILCMSALILACTGVISPPAALSAGGGGIRHAGIKQAGRSLIFAIRTASPVALRKLRRFPDFSRPKARYLCLALHRPGSHHEKRICLGGASASRHRAGLTRLDGTGKVLGTATLAARVKRPGARKLVVRLLPGEAGLTPRRYRWRAIAGSRCPGPGTCASRFPAGHDGTFRLRPVRAVGCTGGHRGLVRNGPRGHKVVALTFDDGPSSYTSGFLRVLRRKHVNGTFFELGQETPGHARLMRRMLAEGNEIGNHSMHHSPYPGYADLAATSARIKRLTHFRPCLFRPPYGAVSSGVLSAAAQAGMRTVTWDVDPTDWSNPGSGAVYSRVVSAARPGSIILMHDGGGNRSGTLAALPHIIHTLRARGYRFKTVSALLGNRLIYDPYG